MGEFADDANEAWADYDGSEDVEVDDATFYDSPFTVEYEKKKEQARIAFAYLVNSKNN